VTALALLRHGHTQWNREGRLQGRTDIPLDPPARDVLRTLRLPAPWNDVRLCSSPLKRAVETATLLSRHAPQTEDALIEMDWGTWEGARRAELFADPQAGYRHVEDWGWDYTPPGGESPAQVRQRIEPWAVSQLEPAVVVTHIGVMRVLLALATGWQFAGDAPFQIKRNRLYVIRRSGSGWSLDPEPIRLESRP
jgi:probable phosphoglycerate mutase